MLDYPFGAEMTGSSCAMQQMRSGRRTPFATSRFVSAPAASGCGATLRQLNDFKGQQLIDGVIELVDLCRPLHFSIVGGDPLVFYRELETLLPLLLDRGIQVQPVTSDFRPIKAEWASLQHFTVVVSSDGLPAATRYTAGTGDL